MLKLLEHYVEATSKDDEAAFTSSGFALKTTTRTSGQPLSQPIIVKIGQGKTGELLVTVTPTPNKAMYELRYTPAVPGLTPGTTYAFQVCAHGKGKQTDWSDSGTRMCI